LSTNPIQSVTLSWSRLGSSIESQTGETITASLTAGWQVEHTATATEAQIIFADGIPKLGSWYPGTSIPCTSISKPERLSPIYSIVITTFSAERSRQQPDPFQSSPLNAPAEIQWGDSQSNEPIDQDVDGNPIVNANGEAIDGITMDLPDPVLSVTKNFATYNPHLIYQYRRSVNSDTFYSFPPGTARLVSQSATRVIDETPYWKVNARIQFRYPINTTAEKAWYARVRHEGFKVKQGSDIVHAVDDSTPPQRVVKPVLLKLNGEEEKDKDAAVWLEFKRYNALPYNALGLF
jgi:hypothetical protein